MSTIFNNSRFKDRRQSLRRDMPKAEVILWQQLKGDKLGHRFRRQYGVGSYIVDFYCPRLRFAIEVDGPSHFLTDEKEEYDRRRSVFMEALGITVLRCTNDDVYSNLGGVVTTIMHETQKLSNSLPLADHQPLHKNQK
jgi:very-short-patch-repair endonuclease